MVWAWYCAKHSAHINSLESSRPCESGVSNTYRRDTRGSKRLRCLPKVPHLVNEKCPDSGPRLSPLHLTAACGRHSEALGRQRERLVPRLGSNLLLPDSPEVPRPRPRLSLPGCSPQPLLPTGPEHLSWLPGGVLQLLVFPLQISGEMHAEPHLRCVFWHLERRMPGLMGTRVLSSSELSRTLPARFPLLSGFPHPGGLSCNRRTGSRPTYDDQCS